MVDLARELDTTPALVEVMLEDLGRMGYLKRVVSSCGEGCGECSLAGLCATEANGQVWTLTEKISEMQMEPSNVNNINTP